MNTYEFHEIANIFPMMSEEEKAQLKVGIQEKGYDSSHPIWIYEGKILDGRNRYEICKGLGILPPFQDYAGNDPIGFVVQENLLRRQLTQSQKAAVAVGIKHEWQKLNPQGRPINGAKNGTISVGKNRDLAGKLVGVGHTYIDEAERIQRKDPIVFEAIKSGEKTISEVNHEARMKKRELALDAREDDIDDRPIVPYGDNIYYLSAAWQDRHPDFIYVDDKELLPTLKRRSWFYHKETKAEFSLREYAQVQEFPDSFKFVGTYEKIKDQIGNAVAPTMAKFVGQKLEGKTIGDLFAGCGGLSCGLEMDGKKAIWAIERSVDYARTYKVNHPQAKVYTRDIKKLDPKNFEKVDIIVGGPPCQGFSLSGKRFNDDPRNELYKEFVRFVNELQPQEFLLENVPQIREMEQQIREDFELIGYIVETMLVKGEDIGMRQRRHRFFFLGKKNGND